MARTGLMLFLFLLLILPVNGQGLSSSQTAPALVGFAAEQNIVVSLINYDSDFINPVDIEAQLPDDLYVHRDITINYDIQFASDDYEGMVNDYIDSIAQEDWTSKLNVTAINEQKENFERKDIFEQQQGTAIDARALEEYLSQNLPSTDLPDDNLFHIFVFNLSRLDNGNHHWFNVTEIDVDANGPRFFWRLEWDYPLNYDVKFPYPAFSESYEFAMLDPTAFQWYLHWRSIWNNNARTHPTYNQTLTEYMADQTTPQAMANVAEETIARWMEDWMIQVFNSYSDPVALGSSMDVQLRVLYDSTQKSQQDLEWIINDAEIESTTNKILQAPEFEVNTEFIDITQDTYMNNFLASKQVSYFALQERSSPFENWTYYDGNSIWGSIAGDETLNNLYFDDPPLEITVRGIILLLDNASYVAGLQFIPWTGGLYTGLGGNEIVTMLWELDRAFMPDGVTRKAGLSKVLIHEIGHAIGFPHPFADSYIADFGSEVMGYYPGTSNYSQLFAKIYQRNAFFKQVTEFQSVYSQARVNLDNDAMLDAAEKFDAAVDIYKTKNYLRAYFDLIEIENCLITQIQGGSCGETPTTTEPTASEPTDTERTAPIPVIIPTVIVALPLLYAMKRKR